MKQMEEILSLVIILFVVLKITDWNHMSVADYILVFLFAIYAALALIQAVKRRNENAKEKNKNRR